MAISTGTINVSSPLRPRLPTFRFSIEHTSCLLHTFQDRERSLNPAIHHLALQPTGAMSAMMLHSPARMGIRAVAPSRAGVLKRVALSSNRHIPSSSSITVCRCAPLRTSDLISLPSHHPAHHSRKRKRILRVEYLYPRSSLYLPRSYKTLHEGT